MLDRLLETGPRGKKSSWSGAASVVVHGVIIVLAVVSTAIGNPAPKFTGEGTHVIPIQPPHVEPGRTTRGGSRTGSASTDFLPIPTVNVPTAFDPTTLDAPPVTTGSGADTTLLSEIGGGGNGSGAPVGGAAIASDATVDVPVRSLSDRAPDYPEMLRAAGISGSVRVRFVVDTTGRAELASVRVLESSHELFTRSVLASLRQARFTSGEVSGRRVRTLVERSYRFDIASAGR